MKDSKDLKNLLARWWRKSQQASPARIRGLSRRRLVEIFGEHGLINGAEIGVDRGKFSEWMFDHIPGLHLYCVDPWRWKLRGESRYNSTCARLASRNATIIRKKSMDALKDISDGSLDFVYIDGDHTFDHVMSDIIWWSYKVRMGGIVAGHDLYAFRRAGVVAAVEAYTRQHVITQWFQTDYLKDRTPSWFWIREPSFVDPLPELKEEKP